MAMGWARDQMMARARMNRLADRYRGFAVNGLQGESPVYEKLLLAAAESREVLDFIAGLPPDKQQPQLFLAAVRHLHGVPQTGEELVELVRLDQPAIRQVMLSRSTQTNEPARCSVLLPLLARLPQPLALIEVGASAGLCLLPDRYGYDYGAVRIEPPAALRERAPVFTCETTGPVPFPIALPRVAWRRGLDLEPIDVRSDDQVGWLETLVWPGQGDRTRLLRAAIEVARLDPPRIVKGDLRRDLKALLALAPRDATRVVYHSGVLQFVTSQAERDAFGAMVMNAGAVWISNEARWAFPAGLRDAPEPPRPGRSLLMLNGEGVAWTGPHGQSLDWFGAV